ncbi:MAG: thioredoxin [Microbacteriaceae bacterium]|nr:MAG: thioredoxin [Microbacteriaceae bacterium]
MNVLLALAIAIGLVAATTVGGLVLRSRTGRVSDAQADIVRPADLPSSAEFGSRATLLQFSTEFCSPCRATHRLLGELAAERPGVGHLDVDLTEHPELATRFHILQTPTTLLLDASGTVQARIGGAPRSDELVTRLDNLIGNTHVAA